MTQEQDNAKGPEPIQGPEGTVRNHDWFSTGRVVVGIALAAVVLWGFWSFLGRFDKEEPPSAVSVEEPETGHVAEKEETRDLSDKAAEPLHPAAVPSIEEPAEDLSRLTEELAIFHDGETKGIAFVEAIISAFDHELNERFWGWRRNDILRFTDNVENIQLGALEVVRRASVSLAEKLSRHGTADVIDENLLNAMNWFMVKPDRYWLPSPESKYNDGLDELEAYAKKLERGEARFYTRSDSLIPLLTSFVELLGSCDENLVKAKEEDGKPVSWFKVDDYFYYAKGVTTAMGKILEAVEKDFAGVVEERRGADLLEHAIHSCHVAAHLDPWLVTDSSLDGVLANHRANMAAPISHARYYLDVLIKTLLT